MTTSGEITRDVINNFFSITEQVKPLNIAPTATGGAGIDNLDKYPPPKPTISVEKKKDTEYVKKYQEMTLLQEEKKRSVNVVTGSTYSISGIDDVDDLSTLIGDPEVQELDNEVTAQIYETYYSNNEVVYNPDLNVTNYRDEIIHQLNINPVVIIQGPTGCGKTTQVPQYILDHYAQKGKYCNIIVTQPRKIAAISIAKRVCDERKWELGTIVGYQVAMDPKVSEDTCLCYVTTGVLLEKLVAEKNMNKYTHVIIDEVHERDSDIDFALLLVKKFLLTNSQKVKVILMSATFDTSIFAKYFSLSSRRDLAPVVEISGKCMEVTEHYLSELKPLITRMPEYDLNEPRIDPCLYDVVVKLLEVFDSIEKKEQNIPPEQPHAPCRGAVLIFLPGYDEIALLSGKLTTARFNKKYWVIPLHSMITLKEQSQVFQKTKPGDRKVIISTNIAESSITVPDVKYVIDFCLTKCLTTDPLTNYSCLKLEWASKANCIQRRGRAGRVSIGKVYRMVPKQFYERFQPYGIPEIKRCPLTQTILYVKKLDICQPEELLAFALDPPYSLDIQTAVLQLKEALALYGKGSNCDGELTFIGKVMASLPLDIKLSKLIIFGYAFSCLEDCIIIAASLSLQSFFAKPFQRALESYRSRLAWANNTFSDCFAYLEAYKIWRQHSNQSAFLRPGGMNEKQWAEKHYIQIRRIKEADLLVKELKSRLERHNIRVDTQHRNQVNPEEKAKSDLILKIVIAGAFFPHYFLQGALNEKDVLREVNENDPLSTVVVTGLPANHGLLYASALRDMFSITSNEINIEFDERKAFIKFQRNNAPHSPEENMPARSVLPAVYLAVKMRLLDMSLMLTLFNREEAERKMEQINMLKAASSSEKMLSTNRYTVNCKSTLRRVPLPTPDTSCLPVYVSHAHNCGHFWVRYMTPENSNHLRFVETMLLNYEKEKGLTPLQVPPVAGMLCLAPFREHRGGPKQYYRAQIRSISMKEVTVQFLDYGNEDCVEIEDLKEISEDLPDVKNTPALAVECKLAHVKPASNHLGKWSEAANNWFHRTVNGVKLHANIYSVVKDTIRLELMKSGEDNTIEIINKTLINRGFAEPAEEDLLSKQNHEYRESCCRYNSEGGVGSHPVDSTYVPLEITLKDVLEFNNIEKTGSKLRLKGPSNPLEISYCGLTNMDRCKIIKVERDSVNSVSFNPDPQDQNFSMLVASSLTIGQRSDVVQARNTTLMPKILGLPSLVCLMFTPYAEIRVDKERKSYTGALCGLGFDATNGEPLYQDHDLEIEFDIEISVKDIVDINSIRMGLNMLLQTKDESKAKLDRIKQKLREFIPALLAKKRVPKEPYVSHHGGQWNQVPNLLLLTPEVDTTADSPDVFPLHKPPSLQGFNMKDF